MHGVAWWKYFNKQNQEHSTLLENGGSKHIIFLYT